MHQIKIFKSVDTELAEMEHQINRWMRKSGARIVSITGNLASQPSAGGATPMSSFAAGDVLVIVLYEIDPPKKREK